MARRWASLACALTWVAVVWVAVLACALGLATLAAAEGAKLLEACHGGKLEVCHEMLARPRLAAGTRAAIELLLEEIDAKLKTCAAGDAAVCEQMAREHPDLPRQ